MSKDRKWIQRDGKIEEGKEKGKMEKERGGMKGNGKRCHTGTSFPPLPAQNIGLEDKQSKWLPNVWFSRKRKVVVPWLVKRFYKV